MKLPGPWRATRLDDDLRRVGVGLDFDDSAWPLIDVPGHWRSNESFADNDAPLLYRTRFEAHPPAPDQRRWVVLDGIFYQGDVWFDGAYLGDPEGYFFPHAFDVTELSRLSAEHTLAVELTCSPQRDQRNKRALTGVFQHSDYLDPSWNPGGLWQPVHLETTGAVRIESLRVLCTDASSERANVRFHTVLDSDRTRQITLTSRIGDRKERATEYTLAAGLNTIEWTIGYDQPDLWWPWSLGEQRLTDVSVEVSVDGTSSHRVVKRTGMRQVAMRDWVFSINGERLFLKGANLAPARRALGEVPTDDLHRDVTLAKDAGLDLVRINGHIARPELYDACDTAGMLVWQDMPLQWGYARQVAKQAVRQARRAVDEFGHHPSIIVWCGHNEPFRISHPHDRAFDIAHYTAQFAAAQQLPNSNRTLLDLRIKRALDQADGSRPVIAHSGVLPHLPQLSGTDSHLYLGWYTGAATELVGLAANMPRLVRFVGEFGAQSVPTTAEWLEPERWPNLDWDDLERRTGMQRQLFERHVPPAAHATFEAWRDATQRYQAELVRFHVEHLRRLKYSPTGGFCVFQLADAQPGVSWGLLDHERVPKAAFVALTDACRPVIVVADPLPAQVHMGDPFGVDINVVNDLRVPLDDGEITAVLRWPGGEHTWRYSGSVAADSCSRIATLQFLVAHAAGPLTLDITLSSSHAVATNRYTSTIVPKR